MRQKFGYQLTHARVLNLFSRSKKKKIKPRVNFPVHAHLKPAYNKCIRVAHNAREHAAQSEVTTSWKETLWWQSAMLLDGPSHLTLPQSSENLSITVNFRQCQFLITQATKNCHFQQNVGNYSFTFKKTWKILFQSMTTFSVIFCKLRTNLVLQSNFVNQ